MTPEMKPLLVVMLAVIFVGGIGAALVINGTFKQNRWGLNPFPISCPSCGAVQPRVRMPTSLRQMLWGGQTCKVCGTEMDKWGRPIGPSLNTPEKD